MIARSNLVYSKGYKYQLKERFCAPTILRPAERVEIPGYVLLDTDGDLYISAAKMPTAQMIKSNMQPVPQLYHGEPLDILWWISRP